MLWLIGVDALRFFAIVLILIYHLFRQILPGGFLAVEIFFTLSGFFLTTQLLLAYSETEKIPYMHFVKRRFFRLFPPLFICVIFTLFLSLFLSPDLLAGLRLRALTALFFSTNWLELFTGGSYENTISPNLFEQTWFLALEFQFILLAPLIFSGFLSLFRQKRRAIKSLGFFLLLLALASSALMFLYGAVFGNANRAYFAPDTHFFAFFLGGAFAVFNFLVPRTPRTPKILPALGLFISLFIVILFATKLSFSSSLIFAFALPFTALLSVIMLACIIKLQPNYHARRRNNLAVFLFDKLGKLSFGLYLFHWPLQMILPQLLPVSAPAFLAPTLCITFSLFLAFFCNLLLRFLPKHPRILFASIVAAIFIFIFSFIRAPQTSPITAQLQSQTDSSKNTLPQIIKSSASYLGTNTLVDTVPLAISRSIDNIISDDSATNPSSVQSPVLILGDSVTLGAKAELEAAIKHSLVDAVESRGIEQASVLISNYAAAGNLSEIIVISLATNERNITNQILQNILDTAGGNRRIILVSAYAGPYQDRSAQNTALQSFANSHENVYFADWWSIAHDNWSLLYADHIHLNPEGRRAYANLILHVIKEID